MKVSILATRIAGTDGVSFEAENWRQILQGMGHKVEFVAGQLDKPGSLIPELHFQWPKVVEFHDKVVYGNGEYREVEAEIFTLAGKIEGKLREVFNHNKGTDLLVVPNVFSLPMHFPLAVALARVVEELKIPTIARHHDFWWERKRFLNSTMFPFFERWFPPRSPNIYHVIVNSNAKRELKKRCGIEAPIIWDSFDYKSKKLAKKDSFSKNWRADFGIKEDDIVFLQGTRIVPRKNIELAIELVAKLDNPKIVLVLAGYAGDEAGDYEKMLKDLVKKTGIRCKFIGKYVNSDRKILRVQNGKKPRIKRIYTLWDCYKNADFVTYPTAVEGFGNQFVETVYFKKPVIVAPYQVFKEDIAPLGFEVVKLPYKVTEEVIKKVHELIDNPVGVERMVEENFKLGEKYFSYQWVEGKLTKIFKEMGL